MMRRVELGSNVGYRCIRGEDTYRYVDNLITTHIAIVVKTMPCLSASDTGTKESDDAYNTRQFTFSPAPP